MDFSNYSDEQLVLEAKNGNVEAKELVVARNKNLVKSIARSFFLVGGDEEDLLIEGMIGVSKAVDNYKGGIDFRSFASKCIRNHIVSAIRKATSVKNEPLNYYISLSNVVADEDKNSVIISAPTESPETDFIDRESASELKISIENSLSKLENLILTMYLNGYSLQEISVKLNKKYKSIENALGRIRTKVKDILKLR